MNPSLQLLKRIAVLLGDELRERLVFVGGAITPLLITDEAAGDPRTTDDVDAISEVTTLPEYESLAKRLRALGFREDPDGPVCRWNIEDLVFDVMMPVPRLLGFSNRWYADAVRYAERRSVDGVVVRLVSPAYFVATKLEAYLGRGVGEPAASKDLEDLITVVDGRPELLAELLAAPAACKSGSRESSKSCSMRRASIKW